MTSPAIDNAPETHDADITLMTGWMEDHLGCSATVLNRQRRWRPVWHATAVQNGTTRQLLLKGDRTWPTHPYPLDYEMRMQRTLHENGIPVPAILGMCPNPNTIAMEWVEGGRDPGLIQEAIENASVMTDDRWTASLRYMEILADIHRVPPARFAEQGADLPTNPYDLALGNYERFHAMTAQQGITDPLVEFCVRWLRRNYPRDRSGVAFVTGDCGQFLSDGPDVTCVLDVEIGHLGDPMRDLACFRGRHPIENMGDVPALFRHYEQASGVPLDVDAIAFYTVSFLAEAYYGPLFGLREQGKGGDWVEAAVQVAMIGRRCMEALAEIIALNLDDVQLPAPVATPMEDMAFDKLIADLGRLPESVDLQAWQRGILVSLPQYLKQRGHYADWMRDEYLTDLEPILGYRPANLIEADEALLRFVETAGPDQDAALTRFFHRRTLRHCLVIAGEDASEDHLVLAKMEPILSTFAAA